MTRKAWTAQDPFTRCLERWNTGEREAASEMLALVYGDLKQIARALARRESPAGTLHTTTVVHEACVRLLQQESGRWNDRAHLLRVAATVMRHVLIDYARRRKRLKRGTGDRPLPLDEKTVPSRTPSSETILVIDELLTGLAAINPRMAGVYEAYLFGGMTLEEIAAAVGISRATVERDLTAAKAWTRTRLGSRA